MKRNCKICGNEFEVSQRSDPRQTCSPQCLRSLRSRLSSRKHESVDKIAGQRFVPVSPKQLAQAKSRPKNVSASRWRMELSRRRNAQRWPEYSQLLPDPDFLS